MFPTTKRVELIKKKVFIAAALNPDYKVFIVHIAVLNISFDISDEVYPSKRAQITHLKGDKTSTEIPSKYTDFANVFSPKLAAKLTKYISINNHTIELVNN